MTNAEKVGCRLSHSEASGVIEGQIRVEVILSTLLCQVRPFCPHASGLTKKKNKGKNKHAATVPNHAAQPCQSPQSLWIKLGNKPKPEKKNQWELGLVTRASPAIRGRLIIPKSKPKIGRINLAQCKTCLLSEGRNERLIPLYQPLIAKPPSFHFLLLSH